MLTCLNYAIRLSPVASKYFVKYPLTNLASTSCIILRSNLVNSIHTHFLNTSNVTSSRFTTGTSYSNFLLLLIIIFTVVSFNLHTRAIHTTSKRDKRDYYEVLGIPKTATAKEIKTAYYTVCIFIID